MWFTKECNKNILCPRNVKVRLIILDLMIMWFLPGASYDPTAVMKPIVKQQQKSKSSGESYWSQGIPVRKGNITVLRGFHCDSSVHFHWLHILNQAEYRVEAVSNWRDCPVYKKPWDGLLLLTQWRSWTLRTVWTWTSNNLEEYSKWNILQDHTWKAKCSRNI